MSISYATPPRSVNTLSKLIPWASLFNAAPGSPSSFSSVGLPPASQGAIKCCCPHPASCITTLSASEVAEAMSTIGSPLRRVPLTSVKNFSIVLSIYNMDQHTNERQEFPSFIENIPNLWQDFPCFFAETLYLGFDELSI